MKTALPVAAAAVILLAGCASNEGPDSPAPSGAGTAGSAVTAPGATDGASSTTPPAAKAPSTTTTGTSTADAVPTALPTTFTDEKQTITDGDLKDSITVNRIARELPWPTGYKASAQAYELVAVEMTWTPSKDYTIPLRKQDFSINSGTQFPNRVDPLVDETIKAAGWALLPDSIDKGDPVTGWMVFKVDPRKAPKLVLDYNRPAVQITSGGSGTFPAKTFSITLAG